jgi:type VI secretion system protein ImpG
MLEGFFQDELSRLKDLAAEFARTHPALAPMLGRTSTDPDVELLFQGIALQLALVREKIEDDFPEFIHTLAQQLCPQLLQPIPATTIVAFSPKTPLNRSRTIEAGTELDSVPVDGTKCRFRTCAGVEMHPLEVRAAALTQAPGGAQAIELSFALTGLSLTEWAPRRLRLFLADEYPVAAEIYYLLRRQLRGVSFVPECGGSPVELSPDCLQAIGFAEDEPVIAYPPSAFPGYRLLQEYFTIPARFLFLDLVGWECWSQRGAGSRFTVRFELARTPSPTLQVRSESFVLCAVPVVNLFSCDAVPFSLDHRKERYLVLPAGLPREHAQVFSVDRVTGYGQGTGQKRNYRPSEQHHRLSAAEPSFRTSIATSPVRSGSDVFISFCYPSDGAWPEVETVSVDLTCSNGDLPEDLRLGDLCAATSSSPEWASFRNVTSINPGVPPPLANNLLWRLVSHQALNLRSLAEAGNLQELLKIYLFDEAAGRHHSTFAAQRKRIEAIEQVTILNAERIVRGIPVQGSLIGLRINGSHFAGAGDLFLFGCILDAFLAGLVSLNTYTQLTVHEGVKGEVMEWQPRLGQQPLL